MGNSAYLVIEIERNGSFCAGSPIRGRLLLDVQKRISADYLMFRFYGHEKTAVVYTVQVPYEVIVTVTNNGRYETRSETRYRTECRTAHDSANLYSSEVILHRFDGGTVAQGRYAFPFEFTIPSGLPGSQSYSSGGDQFSISYHCQAKLHRPGMLTWNVKNSCEVLLNDEPYISIPTPMFLGPITTKVTFMKVISRGTITFGGKVNSSNVCANESLTFNYGISNESTSRVKAVEIYLNCYISFSADGHHSSSSHNIFTRRIEAASLQGADRLLKKGEREFDSDALLRRINEGEFGLDIGIPNDVRSSYKGRLASVSYELSMAVMTTFGSKNKKIRTEIIFHRCGFNFAGEVPQMEEAIAVPANWNGIEAPNAVLIISENQLKSGIGSEIVEVSVVHDTVDGLTSMVKESNQWQETATLKEWLDHSPNNVNLLTPEAMHSVFQSIKCQYTFYTFCQAIGEAMNSPNSANKCTCRHIAAAAKASPSDSKVAVCATFAPFCSDKKNARDAFKLVELTGGEMSGVMAHYC